MTEGKGTLKKKEKKLNISKASKEPSGLTAPRKLKVLITVVDRAKADFYLDVLEGYEVNMQMIM